MGRQKANGSQSNSARCSFYHAPKLASIIVNSSQLKEAELHHTSHIEVTKNRFSIVSADASALALNQTQHFRPRDARGSNQGFGKTLQRFILLRASVQTLTPMNCSACWNPPAIETCLFPFKWNRNSYAIETLTACSLSVGTACLLHCSPATDLKSPGLRQWRVAPVNVLVNIYFSEWHPLLLWTL